MVRNVVSRLICHFVIARFYFVIARYLYVDFENEELGCVNQKQFSAGGAGALPIYWDKVNIQLTYRPVKIIQSFCFGLLLLNVYLFNFCFLNI